MEQHPIPQQISSYQFKLVGDMTLKQFFQVAGGVLVGLLFYSTNLNGFIKWPMILLSTGLGAAMAFLPFEERPLEKWIIAFFRSIYSPTIYFWKKSEELPVYFTENAQVIPTDASNVSEAYLSSTPQPSVDTKLETAEFSFLSKLTSLFSTQAQPSVSVAPTTTASAAQPVTNTVSDQKVKELIDIPQQTPTAIPKGSPKLIVEERPKPADIGSVIKEEVVSGSRQKSAPISSKSAQFSVDAAPPNPPTIANTVTGQVIDGDRKIIAGAIMEIRDTDGKPVRALKSNMAGHFIIVTPLLNGRYEIKTEKEGYKFEPVSFETNGEVIPPIAITGSKIEGGQNETKTA